MASSQSLAPESIRSYTSGEQIELQQSEKDARLPIAALGEHEDSRTAINEQTEAQPQRDQDDQHIEGAKLALLLAAIIVAVFLVTLNASIVATAIPKITDQFNSVKDVGWYGSGYLLTNCALLPLSAKFYSLFKSKYVFLASVFIFELGSLICATAVSSGMFIGGRAIAGSGAAGIFNGAFTIIAAAAPMEKRPMLSGIAGSTSACGQVIGPLIGGALTERVTWRWCFYLNLPIGASVMALVGIIFIPDSAQKRNSSLSALEMIKTIDVVGFFLFAPATALLLLAIQFGGVSHPWSSATVIGLFVGSGVSFLLWLVWDQWRGDKAMIPWTLFQNRIVSFSCATGFLQWGGLLVLTYYLPIYFQAVKGAAPLLSGVMILPTMLSQVASSLISGWAVSKQGYYLPWALFGSALTGLGAGLMSTFSPHTSTGKWIGYQILAGIGRGMAIQMPVIAVQNCLPKPRIPVGTGLVNFAQYFGGTLFVAFGQTTFANRLGPAVAALAPGVDAEPIIEGGATGLRQLVSPQQLGGVLAAYSRALDQTFYLAAGSGAMAFFTALGMGWKSVKKEKNKENPQ
ncbi:MFS multidrug transporter-like protein [Viridothelium virens]|uniref:MFS multidrug transporter-like protein n=1 Tax=Viridothelium virens TaxID=1048519 RepID=A0A6A6HMJ6_VIRVR|nr:MFS multidrug transporter-like protein [Viridothelium virens]